MKPTHSQKIMARVIFIAFLISFVAMAIIASLSTSGGFGLLSIRYGIWEKVFDSLWLSITACVFFLLGMVLTKITEKEDIEDEQH